MTAPADGNVCEPCVIIVFGATGDLAKRKIFPALHALHRRGFLHPATPVVGVSRRPMSDAALLASLHIDEAGGDADGLRAFAASVRCIVFDHTEATLPAFVTAVDDLARERGAGAARAVYFALPADAFEPTAALLVKGGFFHDDGWRRLCFEKPFGHDLASARELNAKVTRHFDESSTYRIDHYLGKELVRNLMVMRFANPLFGQIWNSAFIDHVQVTIAETLGVEGRAGYYEKAGAVRDMLQNHLMQVLALAAMEAPEALDADSVRDAMVEVVRQLVPPSDGDVVLGQFGPGEVGGRPVPGYREEPGIDPSSPTETFVAVRACIDNPRWQGVPFFLRTGKRMGKKLAEANIVLRAQPGTLFRADRAVEGEPGPNVISIRIQPNEGISVEFTVKAPGEGLRLETAVMEHCHHCVYGLNTAEAYEILLREFLVGDQTLFTRWDFVEASWRWVDAITAARGRQSAAFPNYAAGTSGPAEAEALLGDGRDWLVSRDILS
ncbi:MAG: glucose-6-phosphate dehydrogenase [bacterium]